MSASFPITRKQREALDFISQYMRENEGLSPTFEEIMVGTGLLSKSSVARLVVGLKERGRIDYLRARARTIVVLTP